MSRDQIGTRLTQVIGAITAGNRSKMPPRTNMRRSPQLESLEGRALMATINASATFSSVPDGADFQYTLTLNNSSTSNSGIGTFWYAWVPGKDFLATSPIAVTPPAGWTDNVTHGGSTDGYAIQFVASSPAYDVPAGSAMTFSFVSADAPSSVDGNSVDYPTTPVNTFFVYPGAPFSDAGHQFIATQTQTSTPTPTSPTPTPTSASPTPTPTATAQPLVSVTDVELEFNKKRMVTQITIDFSGAINAGEAGEVTTYRLTRRARKVLSLPGTPRLSSCGRRLTMLPLTR